MKLRFAPLVSEPSYYTLDVDPRVRASLIADGAHLPLRTGSIGTVVIAEVLEHVENPFVVASEVIRTMVPHGVCIATTPYDLPIHNHPRDFFRPSPDALDFLFRSLPRRIVGYQGRREFPHTVMLVGFKGTDVDVESFRAEFSEKLRPRMMENPWRWLAGVPHFRHNPYVRSLTQSNHYGFESRIGTVGQLEGG